MSEQEILNKLQDIIRDVLGRDDVIITKKTDLEALGVTSFSFVQLVCAIEEEFDIEIPNSAIMSITTIPSAIKYIQKNTKKGS